MILFANLCGLSYGIRDMIVAMGALDVLLLFESEITTKYYSERDLITFLGCC